MPPDAMTDKPVSRASAAVCATSGPDARAVARDVRVQDRADRDVGEGAREIDGARLAHGVHPSVATMPPFASTATMTRFGKVLAECTHHRGLAQRGGAEDDALGAAREVALGRLARAHAAADLHARAERRDDRADHAFLDAASGARAVEIDDVQTLGALRAKSFRARGRDRRRRR